MIEFKYKDKLFYTTNLPKKLKRLKITENDIEILREYNEQKQPEKIEYEDCFYCYFYNSDNKIFHVIISKDHTKQNKYNVFKNSIWNENTKTGIKNFTNEYIDKLILLNGKPKFPITLDENKLPILEIIYDWKEK
jgi:hypothetical protein